MPAINAKEYLEYLDKEMTIMGILSTFCAAAVALVLGRIGDIDLTKKTVFLAIWEQHAVAVLTGSGLLLLAALFFYLQRSTLAYFYGGISLSLSNHEEAPTYHGRGHRQAVKERSQWRTTNWLTEADSWATWFRYRVGFLCLSLAFYAYATEVSGVTLAGKILPDLPWWIIPALLALEQVFHIGILDKNRYETAPFRRFLESIFPGLK